MTQQQENKQLAIDLLAHSGVQNEMNKRTMTKEITYHIDKVDGIVSLHKHDRTCANQLAEGFGESIGMFVTMLANEVDRMPRNSSISITVTKEL